MGRWIFIRCTAQIWVDQRLTGVWPRVAGDELWLWCRRWRRLRWSSGDGKGWTTCSLTRRGREQDRWCRFLPGASRRGDRSGSRRRLDAGEVPLLDLLRKKIGERVREVHWVEVRRVQVRREAAAYRRRRISSGMLAVAVDSGDESQRPGGANWRGEKGEKGRRTRG